MINSDLIIIGSGPGGYRAAEHAAKNGLQVVIFEGMDAGGTCLNCGCIPTKTLCHEASCEEKDFQRAIKRKEEVILQLRQGVEQMMASPGISFIRGWATFKDTNTIVCNNEEYHASNIIIATGSSPKFAPIKGKELPIVVTSTQLLNISFIPSSLIIIGAGVIGMEFASIYNRFGSQVTVIEYLGECLPTMDSDIAKRLRKNLEKQGITFYLQSSVKTIENDSVIFERKGKETKVSAERVLIATGRKQNIHTLNLEATNIVYDQNGIKVNPETFEVITNQEAPVEHAASRPKIFAIGDVNGLTLLAHAATMQGIHAVNQILGKEDHIQHHIMPAAVFTTPEVASVGLTEEQCKHRGIPYTCKKGLFRSNGKAMATGQTEGILKLIVETRENEDASKEIDGRILGAHCMGAHAADIIQEVTVLMNLNAKISQLKDIIHIHPTLGEILHDTAELF